MTEKQQLREQAFKRIRKEHFGKSDRWCRSQAKIWADMELRRRRGK